MATRIELQEQVVGYLIQSIIEKYEPTEIQEFQKSITDGQIKQGATLGETVVLYQEDYQSVNFINSPSFKFYIDCHANPGVSGGYNNFSNLTLTLNSQNGQVSFSMAANANIDADPFFGQSCTNIPNLFLAAGDIAILGNLSQLVGLTQQSTSVKTDQADLYLDTNIFELLPEHQTKQQRVDAFFSEFEELINPQTPTFDMEGFWDDTQTSASYDDNSVSSDKVDGYITRVESEADSENQNKTLEYIAQKVDTYLEDLTAVSSPETLLPEYEEQSAGYLKIRNLNQMIIIRNQEGNDIGLEDWETDGFTITMWVKFLDKVNDGTLFNYGNPFRTTNPQGFSLDTFISDDEKRYVRLTARETLDITGVDRTIDSHVGNSENPKKADVTQAADSQYTEIPIDLNEWYFIVATYDTAKINDNITNNTYDNNPYYWNGNIDENGNLTHDSVTLGNKCKVEIISKTDLLRARGYNV
jgi:hypothetical protein